MKKTFEKGADCALLFLFFVSFLLWAYCFKGFLLDKLSLTSDAVSYYNHIRFFIDYLGQGIFPIWDPNWNGGVANEFFLRRMGGFNPFYYFIVIFRQLGLPHISAYFLFLSLYWFLGGIGFYKLAKLVFKNTSIAFFCYLLLLFSSLGTRLFDSYINLIFVPMVWFFYFLVAFTQRPKTYSLLGATLAFMILLTTYIPFYFLVIFLTFLILFCIFYLRRLKNILSRYIQFSLNHKMLVVFCCTAVLLSLLPGLIIFQQGSSGEFVMPHRSYTVESQNVFEVAKTVITPWAILEELVYASAFWDLQKFKFAVIYVPGFVFIVLLLGLATAVSRRFLFFFSLGAFFFLLGTPDLSSMYLFLNEHIFFFKFFRNLHFFLWLIILPSFILLAGDQLTQIFEYRPQTRKESFAVFFLIFGIHLGGAYFIYTAGGVILSTYLVIFLSFIFFAFYVQGWFDQRNSLQLFWILALVVIQPLEVYHYLNQNSHRKGSAYTYDRPYRDFQFTRQEPMEPFQGQVDPKRVREWLDTNPRKSSGLHYVAKWFETLRSNIHFALFHEYVRHKFLVYDNVEYISSTNTDYQRVEEVFIENKNVAFVSSEVNGKEGPPDQGNNPHVLKIDGNSREFQLLEYNANSIKVRTHFSSRKFLVYNDNFHRAWQVFINDQKAELFRANIAFKGAWVPPGEQVVHFKYGTTRMYIINFSLIILFHIIFLSLLWTWRIAGKEGGDEEYS